MTELKGTKEAIPREASLPPIPRCLSDAQDQASLSTLVTPKRGSITIFIAKSDPALEQVAPEIEGIIREAVEWCRDKVPLPNVDILVGRDPFQVIPRTGVAGYAPTAHLVRLAVDPKSAPLDDRMKLEVGATIVHELHHCSRWSGPGYGTTLFEALVSEGLAQHFETDFRFERSEGKPRDQVAPFYAKVPSESKLEELTARAREEFHKPNYSPEDHSEWFFGAGKRGIPLYAGYAIGFDLVGTFLEKHKGTHTAATLVREPAKTFYEKGNASELAEES